MLRIFLALTLLMPFFGPSSFTDNSVDKVNLPADVTATTEPFLTALKNGDQAAAEKFMAPSFIDDSRLQFATMSALAKKSPPLVSALYTPKPGTFGPNNNEVSVTYAANDGNQWYSAEIRMYRPEGGRFEVEYWEVKAGKEAPALLAHAKEMRNFMGWLMGGIAVSALLGLGILIWIVTSRTHIVSPEPVLEMRRVAATVRDAQKNE